MKYMGAEETVTMSKPTNIGIDLFLKHLVILYYPTRLNVKEAMY